MRNKKVLSLLNNLPHTTLAEIGVHEGSHVEGILDNLEDVKTMYLIDPYCQSAYLESSQRESFKIKQVIRFMELGYILPQDFLPSEAPFISDIVRLINDGIQIAAMHANPGFFLKERYAPIIAKRRLKKYSHGTDLCWIEDFSLTAASEIPDNSLDYIYIDGNHEYEYVKSDISTYLPKMKKGSIMAGHDFGRENNGVEKAVREVFGSSYYQYSGDPVEWYIVIT